MEKSTGVKNRLIEVTTELIEQHDGNVKEITARMIAGKAGVGLGLINYHFGSKDRLVTECVQRMIGKVVAEFRLMNQYETDQQRLKACAACVFHFLFEHSALARVSILGDWQNYTENCNTALAQRGFWTVLKKEMPEGNRPVAAFVLTAAMQAAFLGGETAGRLLGYDFADAGDRDAYIGKLVDILFEGTVRAGE